MNLHKYVALSSLADFRVRKTGGVLVLEYPTQSIVFGSDALALVAPGSKVYVHSNTMGRAQASSIARALKEKGAVLNWNYAEKKIVKSPINDRPIP